MTFWWIQLNCQGMFCFSRIIPFIPKTILLVFYGIPWCSIETITATESMALNLEYHYKEADAESFRQKVSHILNKNRT